MATLRVARESARLDPSLGKERLVQDDVSLVQLFGLDADVLLAGLALLPVFAHPSFVTFAGCGIASAEGEGGDIGVRDIQLLIRVRGIDADERIGKRCSGATIENVAINLLAVFQSDGNIAAVIECFFERDASLFFRGELRDPAFQVLVLRSGSDLERVGFV